jgi:hypothetical protein
MLRPVLVSAVIEFLENGSVDRSQVPYVQEEISPMYIGVLHSTSFMGGGVWSCAVLSIDKPQLRVTLLTAERRWTTMYNNHISVIQGFLARK